MTVRHMLSQAEEDADSYGSWEAFIAEMRRRWLAGEPISPGPWYKPPRDTTGPSTSQDSAA